jgi:hypothetical protein
MQAHCMHGACNKTQQAACMTDLSIAEYAARLGISADTVRRRIRAGQIPARSDARGRYVVTIPDEEAGDLHTAPMQSEDSAALRRELVHAREIVALERQHGEDLQHRLDQAERDRAELLQLVNQAQQLAAAHLLPAPSEEPAVMAERSAPALGSWWREFREGKRSLGASLMLTGIVASAAGVILHFALRANVVETAVHLGYIIGLVGLLSLLIGLVLVF